MNKTDFEDYKNDNKTFGDIIAYANNKIKNYAIQQGALESDDSFETYSYNMNGRPSFDTDFTNQILNKHLINQYTFKINSVSFRFIININGYNYETWGRNDVIIYQGNDDSIWPN